MERKCYFYLLPLLLLTLSVSCKQTGPQRGPDTSPYKVLGSFQGKGLTEKDRSLKKQLREAHQNAPPLTKQYDLLSEVIGYLSQLSDREIEEKVEASASVLTDSLTDEKMPPKYIGRWYRLRGSPASVPQQTPFQGALDVDADLRQIVCQNPFELSSSSNLLFYEVLSLQSFPKGLSSDKILEMDGLLWKTWDLSPDQSGRFAKTNQAQMPVFLILNYRVVDEK